MKRLWLSILAVLTMIGMLSAPALPVSAAVAEAHHTNIYLFWGDGCPHCAKAKPFLEKLDADSPAISLYKYEVYYDSGNQQLLQKVADKLHIEASGVPVIVVGDEATIGYSESMAGQIQDRVNSCTKNGCPDSIADIVGMKAPSGTISITTPDKETSKPQDSPSRNNEDIVHLPVFGDVHTKDFSLPLLTIIIGGLDGFNPCAMWVLLFLISVILGMKSRRRMWVLGGAFIASSAFVYFLFMTAWLNIFLFIGYVSWVKVLIGLVALAGGSYYLYDYFKNKNGGCRVTGDERRQKMFEKIRTITHERSFWIALVGIVLLAFAVNLVEMVCSAGLPAVYTHVLSASHLPTWEYYAYLGLYILVFMVDDLFVFLMAMLTLKMVGVQEKYARFAHLMGGIVMLIIGVLLLFAPQLLMFG